MNEWIICSANFYDDGVVHPHSPKNIATGFVTCGRRHHNCIHTFAQIVGFPYSKEAEELQNKEVQGFLTNTNRFVNREEAWEIAKKAKQIISPYSSGKRDLFSEDLY